MKRILFLMLIFVNFLCYSQNVVEKHLDFNGQDFLYQIRNANFEKCCFLIHGFGDSYSSFENLFSFFDSLKLKTVYFDLQGMGENKSVKSNFSDVLKLINLIFEREKCSQNFAIGHSMGGLILLLATLENSLKFEKILIIEGSISAADFNFFRYLQSQSMENFIQKKRENKGYSAIYSRNLKNSDTTQLRIFARTIYENFETYRNKILTSEVKFLYVFGRNSANLDSRKELGSYKNIDTLSFANSQHWVHWDAFFEFKFFLKNSFFSK